MSRSEADAHGLTHDDRTASARAPGAEPTRTFRIIVSESASKELVGGCTIGSHALNDVVIDDATVSRFHCEIRVEPDGARIVDLRSKNGTVVDGLRVADAYLRDGSTLQLGNARLRFELLGETAAAPVSTSTRFGGLVGSSRRMRAAIGLLERVAASDATVLLEGETGTGKGRAAEAVHRAGARKDGPFVVVDCGAIPINLLESELFGHEKGAFTGAEARRVGAFEEAHGGTLFLDEIGEMAPDLQPKLLRALENREIRRVGSNRYLPVDLRVIAATNRDLRAEVNAGRFRSDLYYRLAVVKVPLPSVRERPEDLPLLVAELLRQLGTPADAAARLTTPAALLELERSAWPGNVRELRNHLEARLVLEGPAAPSGSPPAAPAVSSAGPAPDADLVFPDARKRALDAFERGYLEALMRRFPGKVAQAAQAAGIDRVYLYRLLRRHGVKTG